MNTNKNNHGQQSELVDPLTERELEILSLLADGWTDRKIAHHLVLSLNTVKWYNKRVYSKLGVKNRTQAVKQANDLGLFGSSLPPAPLEKPKHNLPASTTPFVGREAELRNLIDLVASESVRLVTILAAGGMGKTRLALATAKSQVESFEHGVYFIPMVQLREADNIIPTIASVLSVQLPSFSDSTSQVLNYLRDKEMLLVVDNFEHLLDGASIITTLLENAPDIKLIVTSRERLNLRGETVYALGGMTLPTERTHEEILKCSAIQLFLQRAKMTRMTSNVTDDELPFVIKICRLVWGMPLGIELAASLVEMLSLEEIASEIEHSYDILATEMRDMPPRLRSIRAIFDYSWLRLTEAEQDVYMRLAVFRGGFTREAAQDVVGADLRILTKLANKSLLQREPDRGRYIIHELLRQYAEDHLTASGQAEVTHQAHMSYYTNLMSLLDARIKGADQLEALNQIEMDIENFREAWQWAINLSEFEAINKSLEAIYWFCQIRARVPDGEMLFRQAREQFGLSFDVDAHPVQRRLLLRFDASGDTYREQIQQMLVISREHGTPREIAFFLWMLGVNSYVSGDFDQAITSMEESHSLFQALGDDFYLTETLHSIGICKRYRGQIEDAKPIEQQLRNLSRRTGNKYALGRALGSQGLIAVFENNNVKAIRDLEEAIAIRSALGDTSGVAMSLMSLSQAAFFRGDLSSAKSLAEDSLSLAKDSNSLPPKTLAFSILGWLASIEEDYNRAWDLCHESLLLAPDPNVSFTALVGLGMAACGLENYSDAIKYMQDMFHANSPWHTARGLTACLPVLAIVHAHQGNSEQAVEVLAFATAHPMNPSVWIDQWALVARLQKRLKTELTVAAFETAWEHGEMLELDTVISDWVNTYR